MQLHSPKRNILHLFLFLVFASALGWFINSYPPEAVWQFGTFYLLLGLAVFFLFQFIFHHVRRAVLGSVGLVTILILRSLNLRHPAYLLLLFACLVSVEYTFFKMRKTK
jgi:hypothetical protein